MRAIDPDQTLASYFCGDAKRFYVALPPGCRVSAPVSSFLLHMLAHMKASNDNGSRVAIIG